jgi:hypothetical protein
MRDHRLYKAWTITFAMAVTLWLLIDIVEHGKVTSGDIAGSVANALVLASMIVFGTLWMRTQGYRQRALAFAVLAMLSVAAFIAARLV